MPANRRRRILIATARIAGVVAVSVLIAFVTRPNEPSYQGKTLSQWVLNYSSGKDFTQNTNEAHAIRSIGTNAIPHLLGWMAGADELLARRVTIDRLWIKLPTVVVNSKPAKTLRQLALGGRAVQLPGFSANAFTVLGPIGAPAISELIRRIQQTNSPFARELAIYAIDYAGSEQPKLVVPILANALDQQGTHDLFAFGALIVLGLPVEPDLRVSELAASLQPRSRGLPFLVVRALYRYGKQAEPAVPALLKMLNSPDGIARLQARDLLRKIAPETLTNAPPPPK